MRELIDGFFASIHAFFFGNSVSLGILSNMDYSKIFFWLFIAFIARLVLLSILKNHPAIRVMMYFIAGVLFFIAASIMPGKEVMLAAKIICFVTTVTGLYYGLMWLPIRFQYDPNADEQIEELLKKGALSEADNEELYRLRKKSKQAYENNIQWLFRPGKVKPTEY